MLRFNENEYYVRIAREVARKSTCIRRQYGAVLVKNNVIISSGFNGSPDGEVGCCNAGECRREKNEDCKAVHAEINAIINADPEKRKGAVLYLAGMENGKPLWNVQPCELCLRVLRNAGISRVVSNWRNDDLAKTPGLPVTGAEETP